MERCQPIKRLKDKKKKKWGKKAFLYLMSCSVTFRYDFVCSDDTCVDRSITVMTELVCFFMFYDPEHGSIVSKYSRATVSTDSVSAVSVIRGLPRPERN
jgi:hypothetical protein